MDKDILLEYNFIPEDEDLASEERMYNQHHSNFIHIMHAINNNKKASKQEMLIKNFEFNFYSNYQAEEDSKGSEWDLVSGLTRNDFCSKTGQSLQTSNCNSVTSNSDSDVDVTELNSPNHLTQNSKLLQNSQELCDGPGLMLTKQPTVCLERMNQARMVNNAHLVSIPTSKDHHSRANNRNNTISLDSDKTFIDLFDSNDNVLSDEQNNVAPTNRSMWAIQARRLALHLEVASKTILPNTNLISGHFK